MNRFRPIFDRESARAVKLKAGEFVSIGDGQQYVITVVGLRYARLENVQTGHTLGLVKLSDIRRVDSSSTGPKSPLDELQGTTTFDRASLLKRR